MQLTSLVIVFILVSLLSLSGCGGGATSDDGVDTGADTDDSSDATPSISGVLVDPYIVGAVLYQDSNDNGEYDSGEPVSTQTNDSGEFTFTESLTVGKTIRIKAQGIHVGRTFDLEITTVVSEDGSVDVISPLTTFLSKGITSQQIADIINKVATDTGSLVNIISSSQIETDPLSGDFLETTIDQLTSSDLNLIQAQLTAYGILKIVQGSDKLSSLSGFELYQSGMNSDGEGAFYQVALAMFKSIASALNTDVLTSIDSAITTGRSALVSNSFGFITQTTADEAMPRPNVETLANTAVTVIDRLSQIGYDVCNENNGDYEAALVAVANASASISQQVETLGKRIYAYQFAGNLAGLSIPTGGFNDFNELPGMDADLLVGYNDKNAGMFGYEFNDSNQLSSISQQTTSANNTTPTVSASLSERVVVLDLATTLKAIAADTDGQNLSYLWSLVSVPESSQRAAFTSTQKEVGFIGDVAGDYVFDVSVFDGFERVSSEITLSVEAVITTNASPTISSLDDRSVEVGTDAFELGLSFEDSDTALSSLVITASNSSSSIASVNVVDNVVTITPTDKAGFSKITITVSDGNQSASTTFTLTLTDTGTGDSATTGPEENILPVANAGQDQTVFEGELVTLNGLGTDQDGSIASYLWHQSSQSADIDTFSALDAATLSFTAPSAPVTNIEHKLYLTLTDNEGLTHQDFVLITVKPTPRTMRGSVVNINDQSAIEGVTIILSDGSSATSLANGSFEITGLPVVEYASVTGFKIGEFTSKSTQYINSDAQDVKLKMIPIEAIDLAIDGGCSVKGTVTNDNGDLISNVDIYLSHPGVDAEFGSDDDIELRVGTNSEGTYLFQGLTLFEGQYFIGSLVGERRDNRNEDYEGNSDLTFNCSTLDIDSDYDTELDGSGNMFKVFTRDFQLHNVVENTGIKGKFLDQLGNPLTKEFNAEIHRMYPDATFDCPHCSNWIDETVRLDSGLSGFGTYDAATGEFEVTELAGNATYSIRLSSSLYANFRTFSDQYFTTQTISGETLDMGTVVVKVLPVANAGQDQTVFEGELVTLNGLGSDQDGSIASYLWHQSSQSADIDTFSALDAATLSFTAPSAPVTNIEHKLYLTVTDNEGLTHQDFVLITVKPGSL